MGTLSIAPGASDALTALLIEEAQFPVVYVTGAGVANTQLGVPDIGLTSLDDMLRVIRAVTAVVRVPVLADADAGYGNAIGVARTVREYERAGAAGVQLEDQVAPKRCGHFEGKLVVDVDEMVSKLRAAQLGRVDPAFVIIARTDSLAVNGLHDAISRARAYANAGADAVFVEAPRSKDEMRRIVREVPGVPHIANMVEGGKTPLLSAQELENLGFSLVLYANFPLRAGMHAVSAALKHLRTTGSSAGSKQAITPMKRRQEIVGLPDFESLEAHVSKKR